MFENIVSNLKDLAQGIACFPELNDTVENIDVMVKDVKSPILIMVMGEFSTGKSSFINALVEKEVTIVNAKPTTAVITKLCYGLDDRITVFFQDGTQKNYSVEDFEALTVESEETIELRKNIDFVERAMPLEMLKSMTIIDSPGLNSLKKSHEETTRRFMDKSDTVIWLFDAHDPCKQTEIDAMKRLNPRLSPLVLVNKIDLLDEEEGDSPEKILSETRRKLRNNRLEVQDIIGISAKLAFRGKKKNDEKALSESNIGEFYNRIETVILPRRDEYKRNAMFDSLARVIFDVGTVLSSKKSENDKQKDTDYAAYIEAEETLALATDALENVSEDFLGFFDLSRNDLSDDQVGKIKLNASERTVFGVLYWLGLLAEKNTEIAQKHLEAAAVRNDAIAQRLFAEICESVGQEDKAKYWWDRLGVEKPAEKQSESSSTQSSSSTVGSGLNSVGVADDKLTAEEMLKKGEEYEGKENYVEAMKWYHKAADAGSDVASKNLKKLQSEIQKDADAGNADAMYNIGDLYYHGYGVNRDYAEAMKWFRKAADAGNAAAMSITLNHSLSTAGSGLNSIGVADDKLTLEEMLKKGEEYEGKENYAEAMKWYCKAADAGDANAMNNIGWLYKKGYGVNQDYAEAMKWFRKAANAGQCVAMLHIGIFYEKGYGVNQDYVEAMKWYRKAADAGIDYAMFGVFQKPPFMGKNTSKRQKTTPN